MPSEDRRLPDRKCKDGALLLPGAEAAESLQQDQRWRCERMRRGSESGRTATERILGSVAECNRANGSKQDTEATLASNGSSLAPLTAPELRSAPVPKAGIDVCDRVAETPAASLRPTLLATAAQRHVVLQSPPGWPHVCAPLHAPHPDSADPAPHCRASDNTGHLHSWATRGAHHLIIHMLPTARLPLNQT